MTKPVVGVIGNAHAIEGKFNTQLVGKRNLRAVAEVAGALPLMFAGTPDITDIEALLGGSREQQHRAEKGGGGRHQPCFRFG